MTSQTGRCLCGQVSYSIDGAPAVTAVCHCTHCQRQSGAAFSVNLMVQESQLTLKGAMTTFEDKGDSGNKVYRKFCGTCGSPILSALEGMPGMVAIKAGTLDDVSGVKPAVQVWCDSKQGWVDLAGMPAFGKSPPSR